MSNSIIKDDEESISVKTAIARWADRAFKAESEIDRLRAENAELVEALRELEHSSEDIWARRKARAILAKAKEGE